MITINCELTDEEARDLFTLISNGDLSIPSVANGSLLVKLLKAETL